MLLTDETLLAIDVGPDGLSGRIRLELLIQRGEPGWRTRMRNLLGLLVSEGLVTATQAQALDAVSMDPVCDDELDGIVHLLKGRYGLLNMIPFNSAPGLPFQRPDWERARAIAAALSRRGVLTKLRDSAGQDVEGGCGQLRAREAVGRPVRVKVVSSASDLSPSPAPAP